MGSILLLLSPSTTPKVGRQVTSKRAAVDSPHILSSFFTSAILLLAVSSKSNAMHTVAKQNTEYNTLSVGVATLIMKLIRAFHNLHVIHQ